jgi:hypothetical protein
VPQDAQQQQRIHVSPGQHGHHRWLEVAGGIQQRRHRCRARGLDDELGPFQAQQQRLRQRLLGHGTDVVDQLPDQSERHVAGAADGDPVGHGRHRGQRHRVPGRERGGIGGRTRCLHPDEADVGPQRLDRDRHPGQQSSPAGAHDDRAHLRALFEYFQTERALPRHDIGMVEGMDEHRTGVDGVLDGGDQRLVHRQAREADLGPVPLRGGDLGQRRSRRHEDGRPGAEQGRGERHPLGMVTRAGGHDPGGPFGGAQVGDAHV